MIGGVAALVHGFAAAQRVRLRNPGADQEGDGQGVHRRCPDAETRFDLLRADGIGEEAEAGRRRMCRDGEPSPRQAAFETSGCAENETGDEDEIELGLHDIPS